MTRLDRIDVRLVQQLIAAQFPQWADLLITPIKFGGHDNRTFHLGEHLLVRLPSAAAYASQAEKEYCWLPKLAPLLKIQIPIPLALGKPSDGYPWHWSVYRWIEGETAAVADCSDLRQFARDLAEFLVALQQIDMTDGPTPGRHNFYRGGSLANYDTETRQAIATLAGNIDGHAAIEVWNTALGSLWDKLPVWVHGDVAVENMLIKNGRLHAVIDFGCSAVGDPACDLVIAWTLFKGESRDVFRAGLSLDSATWARARGWTLWKALIECAKPSNTDDRKFEKLRGMIAELLAEHKRDHGL